MIFLLRWVSLRRLNKSRPNSLKDALFIGELSLDGTLRHVRGALSYAYPTKELLQHALSSRM